MKKSGTRPTPRSGEIVISPQLHEVTIEVLAERHHLTLEAAAQLPHQLLVGWGWSSEHHPSPRGLQRPGAQGPWGEGLDRGLDSGGDRATTDGDGMDEIVELLRAHPHGGVRIPHRDRQRVVHPEELLDLAHGGLVAATELLVDEDQHLLARERRVVAANLLHVLHSLGVEERLGAHRATGDALALTPRRL